MTPPLVTVGITAWNSAGTIEMAVRSALAQDWRPIEIVVVDDASTDETGTILARAAAAHHEIRVFTEPCNGGVAASRNRIIAEARGAFIAFFDDDDESVPGRVGAQLARILDYERDLADGAPVICHTARRRIYPNGVSRIEGTMGQRVGRPAPQGLAVARRILAGDPIDDGNGACPTCSQMARRETYKLVGGFDPSFRRSEDTELCVRLARAGAHFVGIGEPLVTQNMTATADKNLTNELLLFIAIIDKHRDLFENQEAYHFARNWLTLKHQWLERRPFVFATGLVRLMFANPSRAGRRLLGALPNVGINRAFRQFHSGRRA